MKHQTLEQKEEFSAAYTTARNALLSIDKQFEKAINALEILAEVCADDGNATLIEGISGRIIKIRNHCNREIEDNCSNEKYSDFEILYSLSHVTNGRDKVVEIEERLFTTELRNSTKYIVGEDFTEELFQEELTKFKRGNFFVERPNFE